MSWASGQVFEFYTEPRLLVIEGDQWRDCLKIPAADLKANHSYAIVVTGNHGNYVPGQGLGIINAGAIYATYGGTYIADTLQRFDLTWGDMRWPENPIYSQPFTIVANFSCGTTPKDLVIEARCEDTGASPQASFYLEGLAVQIYDLTDWSSIQYLATATAGTLVDYNTGTLTPLLNLTSDLTHGTPAKKWLLWYSVVLQAEDLNVNAASWMTTDPATPKFNHVFSSRGTSNNQGSWLGNSPRGRVGYYHRHHQGSGRVLEVGATGIRPTVWAADMWTAPNPTKPLAVKILAIPIDGIADEVHSDYTATYVAADAWWAPGNNPDWKLAGIETEFFDTLRVLTVARAAFTSPTSRIDGFYSALELDSQRLNPAPLDPMRTKFRATHEVQALHRVGRADVDAGKHCVRHLLWTDSADPYMGGTQLYDHQVLVLSTAPGHGLSRPPADLIGPELVIVPDKEALDVGNLPTLPIEPNTPPSWEEIDPAFELKTPTGYTVSWPMSLEPRRRGPLRWTGLTATDKDTLVDWLRSRKDSGAAFAFMPPDASSALPFVLDGKSFRWTHQSAQHYEVSIEVIELRYTGA